MSTRLLMIALVTGSLTGPAMLASPIAGFHQTNLVSNIPGMAVTTDANLKNPWGIAMSPASPFWISDNGTGLSTLYNTAGTKLGLEVTIPGNGTPTGQVFNGTPGAFNGDAFIFATEDGKIAGWRGGLGTNAEVLQDFSGQGAEFKGLAIGTNGGVVTLYAADFANGKIDVLTDGGGVPPSGNFTDPGLPSGFAPFNIQNLGGALYVTYAKVGVGGDDEAGPGNGFVSKFDLNGNFIQRVITQGALNSPWGLAIAPAGFGSLGGKLLVGNFGDGKINAFDLNGTLVGTLADLGGNPLVNSGLWGLAFGNGKQGGNANSLYLTAGLNDEADGLFAQVDSVPEPATYSLIGAGLALSALARRIRRTRSAAGA
ncbi:TIGR03118 family protein [Paludibaculum fermentans]|uniref:TIGR03118 family protein n=1 Tax=Paludibaculum fermentans TaxID=1473598 RepID=A0A7S7NK98_PALFE|nr:TIGR03118 family protein [Paludibaculum fermentans]QOY85186.1 TIGR03118 family protein [Paludibaculum fermentans]